MVASDDGKISKEEWTSKFLEQMPDDLSDEDFDGFLAQIEASIDGQL